METGILRGVLCAGHLEEDGQRPVTLSMHWVQWLFPGLTASESRREVLCVSVCVLSGLGSIQFPPYLPSVSKSYLKTQYAHFILTDSIHKRVFILNMLNILLDLDRDINLTGVRSAGVCFGVVLLINGNANMHTGHSTTSHCL